MIFKIEIAKCQWAEEGHIKEILLDEKAQGKIGNIMQPTYKLFSKKPKGIDSTLT